ncbi:MAG: T9SS type A sorting domain-containing protein, partial [Bacteroidota bacterium]|nr:T9SS type A sorting domain-containing protein [Bacteroidota bacterium]
LIPIKPKITPSTTQGKMMVELASTLDQYNNGYLIPECIPVIPFTKNIYDQGVPSGYNLEANYPNPFNPTTTISYSLPTMSTVKLTVYDFLGREIAVLVDGVEDAGYKSVEWNAVNTLGSQLASGTYFYRLEATDINDFFNHFKEVRKMFLVK